MSKSIIGLLNFIPRRSIHLPVYKGPHPGINETKKKPIPDSFFEEAFDRIRTIQNSKVEEPSPFHIVWKNKQFHKMNNKQKVICRKLGLNGQELVDPVILPNTPHFNRLLWEIKGSILLRPVNFVDKIPTEEDLGACKVNHYTGEFKVDPIYRVPPERLDYKPLGIYQGTYLRNYLRKLVGVLPLTTCN